jgi:hypothetical protein
MKNPNLFAEKLVKKRISASRHDDEVVSQRVGGLLRRAALVVSLHHKEIIPIPAKPATNLY